MLKFVPLVTYFLLRCVHRAHAPCRAVVVVALVLVRFCVRKCAIDTQKCAAGREKLSGAVNLVKDKKNNYRIINPKAFDKEKKNITPAILGANSWIDTAESIEVAHDQVPVCGRRWLFHSSQNNALTSARIPTPAQVTLPSELTRPIFPEC